MKVFNEVNEQVRLFTSFYPERIDLKLSYASTQDATTITISLHSYSQARYVKYTEITVPERLAGMFFLGAQYFNTGESNLFDSLTINGNRLVKDTDVAKTPEVKAWAAEHLGDKGASGAVPLLQAMITDREITSSSTYLKETAEESLKKINFINSIADPNQRIEIGLTQADIVIRKWAVDELVRQNPSDLEDQLNNLLTTAQTNNDEEFAFYISMKLEELKEGPALVINYPQDGSTVKETTIFVSGSSYGRPFMEELKLNPGINTYTKEVVDHDGNRIVKTITFTQANAAPVLAAIPDKIVRQGQLLTFTVSATDSDDTELTYLAYDLPPGASFDSSTRTFSWTPDLTATGINMPPKPSIYMPKFLVLDTAGLSDLQQANIITTRPPTPVGLTAVSISNNQINVTWKDGLYEAGYALEMAKNNAFNPIQAGFRAGQNVTSYSFQRISPGTYYFRIKAYNDLGESAYSNTVSAVIQGPPAAGTITPSKGLSLSGAAVNLTTSYSDPNGWQDLNQVQLLINTAIDGKNCAYVKYVPSTNKLYFANDAGTAWLGGFTLGSANTIENSYGKLDCAKTTVSSSGNTLTVNWNITFKPSFVGIKNTYLLAIDKASVNSGWVQKGTWEIK